MFARVGVPGEARLAGVIDRGPRRGSARWGDWANVG
jgi:hypothetical protein